MNELIQIDCMEYIKDIPDGYFDLAIVDPPYGLGESGGQFRGRKGDNHRVHIKKKWDTSIPDKTYFFELVRISTNQIIWGGNYFTEMLYPTKGWIYWDKLMGGDFADGELAWTSFSKALRKFTFCNKYHGQIHPTQKPVALYKWLLTNYAKPGYKLFDSHSGSGSFRIAAYDMGFDLVSCELDADYCRDNEARFQKHIQQIDLFKPKEIQEKIYQEKELF